MPLSPDALTAVGLAAALALLAFTTTGGTELAPNTWAEIGLVLIGVCALVAITQRPIAGARNGLPTLVAFGTFAALTVLSITWSVVPDQSWLEANRMLAYLAALGAAIALVRVQPACWRGVIAAIALFAVGLSAWALLGKVFPAALDPGALFGSLQAPFAYRNAVGLVAAMGLPPLVWAGARRDGGPWSRALSVPAIAILLTALVLAYSRSALLAAALGLALWFAATPLRLRGAATLALGALAGAGPTLFALHTHALTHDRIALGPRVDAGDGFGIVLALALVVFTGVGLAGAYATDRVALSERTRRQVGIALLVVLALVPLGGLVGAAASSRGLTGQISHAWSSLTNTNGSVSDAPGRLVQLGNTRALYWSEGITLGEHHPLVGAGAGGYATARTRYTTNRGIVAHAHSFPIETFADLGAVGLLVSLVLFLVWGREALRCLKPGALPPAERTGLLTLASVVVVFGVHSSIDWTWEIPGTAIPALLCAGWLAGRTSGRPARRASSASRVPALAVLLVVTLLAGWAIWQPLRASDAVAAAENALVAGHGGQALTLARTAIARDPLAPQPLWTESDVLAAIGDPAAARSALRRAVELQPQNPATWRILGEFELAHHQPQAALAALTRSRQLDPTSAETDAALQQVRVRRVRPAARGRRATVAAPPGRGPGGRLRAVPRSGR